MTDKIYRKNNKKLDRQKILMENEQALSLEAVVVSTDGVMILMMIIKVTTVTVITISPKGQK